MFCTSTTPTPNFYIAIYIPTELATPAPIETQHITPNPEQYARGSKRPPNPTIHHRLNQIHSHSAKTHHLALLSANTNPLHVPLSPILMIVSHTPPSAPSDVLIALSALRDNLRIFPLGAWMASLAGLDSDDDCGCCELAFEELDACEK